MRRAAMLAAALAATAARANAATASAHRLVAEVTCEACGEPVAAGSARRQR